MPRAADYTIQGFLYQFNKTALEILKAQDEDTITVEGIVEDIEVTSSISLVATQCKYHESKTSFTPSAIYKPLLQMLVHYSKNQSANIKYVLFAHFPGVQTPKPKIDKATLRSALGSQDKELIKKYISKLPKEVDLDGFLTRFEMEFGPSYDDIVKEVSRALEIGGFPKDDIETLAYPNAIHVISKLSIQHNSVDRQITKKKFICDLMAIRTTAISRWTLALKTWESLLQARRKQLKVHLDKNARLRYFVIFPGAIEDFDAEIVLFISDYIEKYHYKPAHIHTPIFCISGGQKNIQDIQRRLYAKGIISTDGYVGAQFEEKYFFRDPMSKGSGLELKREFSIRLLSWDDNGNILNERKCDDLFIVGESDCNQLDSIDVNVEQLSGVSMKEIKYILGVSNVYE